ncbi:SH2 domain-containing adapter protein F-like [Oppia nitens]|uniref:SH2 domain-containing adapter protein F-like n=1 Tax=Oppia nitens TaxID=1686743 RepID=UPI0023D9F846|nr:SH2 domain-containing adapter protein F-like [Oppia nitens]
MAMPSPLNTPTNERLPNQLWNLKTNADKEMSELKLSAQSMDGTDGSHHLNHNNKSTTIITTTSSPTSHNNTNTRLLLSHHLSKNDISPTERSHTNIPSRLGLNLNLGGGGGGDTACHLQSRKKITIDFGSNALPISECEEIDETVPLEKQGWFHGYISRTDAENVLRATRPGSYLVRRCLSSKQHYLLSLKCVRGFMHIKIVEQSDGTHTLGANHTMSFTSIPYLINHYSRNRLPIRGAEHMALLYPVIDQLL